MWNGFESKTFIFKERKATVVFPKGEANGKILLKTEYLGAFPDFDIAMLEKGYHLINIEHFSRWAPDEETEIMASFVKYCAKEYKLNERCVMEGMSCGGLQAARLAQMYPELCAVLYLDAPVLNILSMVGLGEIKCDDIDSFWRELVATYGFNKSTVINFRKSPIDFMDVLIEHNIPVIMLYGNADNVVVYEENGKVLEDYYKENNGRIKVISRSMCGHHPHGLEDSSIIVDFVEKNFQ